MQTQFSPPPVGILDVKKGHFSKIPNISSYIHNCVIGI